MDILRKLKFKEFHVLNDTEMKNATGRAKEEQGGPEKVGESACKGKPTGASCTITWSGGSYSGLCWYDDTYHKPHCGFMPNK
ncbi:MAG: hypothetical protein LBV32_08690 [Tannerellaceae bacterium]|jgi:hypothetical protein|nr:hypothetical protein [Tannerellaceae bacterium]